MSIDESSPVVAPAYPLGLQVLVRPDNHRTRVKLIGELDTATASDLQASLTEVTASLVNDVVLDIEKLSFVDSTGLGLFVTLHKRVEELGQSLTIVAPTPQVIRLFQITGLDAVFNVERV